MSLSHRKNEEEMLEAARGLAGLFDQRAVQRLDSGNLGKDEKGWSGAEVRRMEIIYEDGSRRSVILKRAELKERGAMQVLTQCGHRHTPAAFSPDLETEAPGWMAMEDLGSPQHPSSDDPQWIAKAAKALADIHADHMGKGADMPWLPFTDAAYWQFLVTRISVDHFEKKMEQNADFCREFGKYLPVLREKAAEFAREMTVLSQEKEYLTLTHGDIQTVDGAHIYDCGGQPCMIDFGWCYYAPFYVDLASYFTFEEAKLYYQALISRGISLKYSDFEKRLRTAFRYSGFIYLCPSIMQWGSGPTGQTGKRLLQMLKIILTGEFPEQRIDYSDSLFRQLLQEHRQFSEYTD